MKLTTWQELIDNDYIELIDATGVRRVTVKDYLTLPGERWLGTVPRPLTRLELIARQADARRARS